MIVKSIRYLMIIIAVLVAAIYIPDLYWKIFDVNVKVPMVLYSPVINKFITLRISEASKYTDQEGNKYTREQFEQLEPIFYYRQLVATNTMPESLRGKPVDISSIRVNNFRIKISPPYLNMPKIELYPLLESQSGRVSLEMPDDVFRITSKRIEFIDCTSNKIDEEKSERFTEALNKEGFDYPAKGVYGNPTTRKAFDEGYFIVDNSDQIFHLKMIKGEPFCKNIHAPSGFKVKYMNIAEQVLREFYGVVISDDNLFYFISYNNYQIKEVPVNGYDPKNTTLVFRGDVYFRSIQLTNDDSLVVLMMDRDYKVFDRYVEPLQNVKKMDVGVVEAYLFPFTISQQSPSSFFIGLYFSFYGFSFIILNVLLTILTIGIYRRRGLELKNSVIDFAIVLVTGIYGLLAITIFIPFDKTK